MSITILQQQRFMFCGMRERVTLYHMCIHTCYICYKKYVLWVFMPIIIIRNIMSLWDMHVKSDAIYQKRFSW